MIEFEKAIMTPIMSLLEREFLARKERIAKENPTWAEASVCLVAWAAACGSSRELAAKGLSEIKDAGEFYLPGAPPQQ